MREEEKVGQRDLLDVLNAEQEFLNAQVQLGRTKRDRVVNFYAVPESIGRLDVLTLGAADAVSDPEAHYFDVRRQWWGFSITHADGRHEELDLAPPDDVCHAVK